MKKSKPSPGPRIIKALQGFRDVLKRGEKLGAHYKITARRAEPSVDEMIDLIQNDGGCSRTVPRALRTLELLRPRISGAEYEDLRRIIESTRTACRFGRPEDFDSCIANVRKMIARRLDDPRHRMFKKER